MDARKAELGSSPTPPEDAFPPSHVVTLAPRIEADAARCGGKPCIAGTRVRVGDVIGFFAVGMTVDDIVRDYPSLSREDVFAACDYASRALMGPAVFPTDGRPTH